MHSKRELHQSVSALINGEHISWTSNLPCWLAIASISMTVGCGPGFRSLTKNERDTENSTFISTVQDKDYLEGRVLYEKHCSDCHEPFHMSTKTGKSYNSIVWSLENVPAMKAMPPDLVGVNNTILSKIANTHHHQAMTEWAQCQAGQLISKLKSTSTSTGTLFDSSLFCWGATTSTEGHSKKNVPLNLSGRANGKLTPHLGRRINFEVRGSNADKENYYDFETPRRNVLQSIADILELNYQVPNTGRGRTGVKVL